MIDEFLFYGEELRDRRNAWLRNEEGEGALGS